MRGLVIAVRTGYFGSWRHDVEKAFGMLPSSLKTRSKYRSGRSGVCHMTRTFRNAIRVVVLSQAAIGSPLGGLQMAFLKPISTYIP